jgi:hypothetical protein
LTPEKRDELESKVADLVGRVEDLENERDAIKNLPGAVATIAGQVQVLHDIVIQGFDGHKRVIESEDGQTIQKANSWDTAIKVAAGVVVPLLVALIGGYVLLRTSLPAHR